ncbi:MAG: DUF1329 domain-containing protein [Bacteroidetes bacterium]|nr:MAG: DUF1329 domain-containing protein [Bacteroidota bacterium]
MCTKMITSFLTSRSSILLLWTAFLVVLPLRGVPQAAEWLVPPAFEGAELEKVREWEKTWAGKTINRENVDQVKEFVPEGIYDVMTDSSKFGDYDFSFTVVPYKTFEPTPGLVEATAKYSPQAKMGADEVVESFETMAGVLFPQPKTGLEAAWNFYTWSRGDDFIRYKGRGSPVDIRTKIERGAITSHWTSYYVNRVNKPPLPAITKNRRKIRKARFMHMEAPPHMTDFSSLHIQYIDQFKPDDGWMYWPRFRKITKTETSTRDDVYDGLDWIQDDFPDGFDDKLHVNNYKIIGREKILLGRRVNSDEFEREQGMTLFRGIQRELINALVVEVVHKRPGFVYPKQIWYMDPETWAILFKKIYNSQGELWKTMAIYTEIRNIGEGEVALPTAYTLVDLIRRHGTVDIMGHTDIDKKFSRDSYFSIRNLDRRAY